MDKGPRGMFWTKVAQFGPTGTPRKSAFFQERGRKRMKELGEVTFMKEWVKAPSVGVVLPLTHLQNLVSFPRYGRLKKKCWYKQVCNGTYWLLLTAHFGPVFIRPSQWRITAVWGKYPVFVVPIDKTIKGNSYSNLKLVLPDFQKIYVTLFKTGFVTLQVHFNQ